MKPTLTLMLSPLQNKKYRIIFPSPTSSGIVRETPSDTPAYIDFGATGYYDYINYNLEFGPSVANIHRERYLARHAPREDWTNVYSAGFWSRYLLWEKRSLKSAIKNIEKMIGVNIEVAEPLN
jgi:hypothetical protein